MKVRNKSIKIQVGDETKEFHNYIYDDYLNECANGLINVLVERNMNYCGVEVDGEINWTKEVDLLSEENTGTNTIITKHIYKNVYTNTEDETKQITKIYFGYGTSSSDVTKYAELDLSNYTVYVGYGQNYIIERIDETTTDMEFSSEDVSYPYHLSQRGNANIEDRNYLKTKAQLKAVGKGYSKGNPYILYDITALTTTITDNIVNIKGISIENIETTPIYPSDELYPSNELYPTPGKTNWIILQFQLYKEQTDGTYAPLDKYYTENIYTEKTGDIELKIKYERGE